VSSTARVDFTRGAAERIARVVRIVEQGDRGQGGPTWDSVDSPLPASLKLATFTGDWAVNTLKTVTLYGVTSTPNTASVLNLCTPAVGFSTANTGETRFVIFGKVKYTSTPLVVEIQASPTNTSCVMTLGGANLTKIAGYASTDIQLLGHNTTGPCLEWYSIATCATATSA
jgi:hypothetical protein